MSLGFLPILRDLSVVIKMAIACVQLLTKNNPGGGFAFGLWNRAGIGETQVEGFEKILEKIHNLRQTTEEKALEFCFRSTFLENQLFSGVEP
ncbi:hypothetical protein IQ219_09155 [Synechocystis sp. LEGE 06083]|nr:hypothetical protein [Synechocystis sp. LEGE 06083]